MISTVMHKATPFDYLASKTQCTPNTKNYSDTFVKSEYENKSSVELESYARNLANYLKTLLDQDPFPEFLFDKLEKRLDGIAEILSERKSAAGTRSKGEARNRLIEIMAKIDPFEGEDDSRPPKKQKQDPNYVEEVRNSQLEKRKRSLKTDEVLAKDSDEEGEGEE